MNYYVILGVPRDADLDTIRSAFRALVRRYHPDAGEGSSAERFRQIVTAYETLSDPIRRGHYDRRLQVRRAPPARFVEPLWNHPAPEPLLRRSRRVARTVWQDPLAATAVSDLIDELFHSWVEVVFHGFRRRHGR